MGTYAHACWYNIDDLGDRKSRQLAVPLSKWLRYLTIYLPNFSAIKPTRMRSSQISNVTGALSDINVHLKNIKPDARLTSQIDKLMCSCSMSCVTAKAKLMNAHIYACVFGLHGKQVEGLNYIARTIGKWGMYAHACWYSTDKLGDRKKSRQLAVPFSNWLRYI